VTASLVGYILRGERRVLTVSRLQTDGDLAGVTLSLPTVVGADGATEVVAPPLSNHELVACYENRPVLLM